MFKTGIDLLIVSRDANLWKKLYTTYVRPQLEYAIPVWTPYMHKDIDCLEKIQHRATKIPHSLKSLQYPQRCVEMGLTSLTKRRDRGDLIQMFKFETGIEVINWHNQPLRIPPLYSHRERFHREVVRNCEPRHQFFNNRVTTLWNTLPDTVVQARTLNEFKNRLDSYYSLSSTVLSTRCILCA